MRRQCESESETETVRALRQAAAARAFKDCNQYAFDPIGQWPEYRTHPNGKINGR